jgi:hypothetical protein
VPFFSLSLQKPGRVGEPKTTFNKGELEPTAGEAVELRVDTTAYSSKLAFWSDLYRLLQRVRELDEPRPEFVGVPFVTLFLTEDGQILMAEDGEALLSEAA